MQLVEGGLGNDKDFAHAVFCIFHEFRHVEQAKEYFDGAADKDMLIECMLAKQSPMMYMNNYRNITLIR